MTQRAKTAPISSRPQLLSTSENLESKPVNANNAWFASFPSVSDLALRNRFYRKEYEYTSRLNNCENPLATIPEVTKKLSYLVFDRKNDIKLLKGRKTQLEQYEQRRAEIYAMNDIMTEVKSRQWNSMNDTLPTLQTSSCLSPLSTSSSSAVADVSSSSSVFDTIPNNSPPSSPPISECLAPNLVSPNPLSDNISDTCSTNNTPNVATPSPAKATISVGPSSSHLHMPPQPSVVPSPIKKVSSVSVSSCSLPTTPIRAKALSPTPTSSTSSSTPPPPLATVQLKTAPRNIILSPIRNSSSSFSSFATSTIVIDSSSSLTSSSLTSTLRTQRSSRITTIGSVRKTGIQKRGQSPKAYSKLNQPRRASPSSVLVREGVGNPWQRGIVVAKHQGKSFVKPHGWEKAYVFAELKPLVSL